MTAVSDCNTFVRVERDEVIVVRVPTALKTAIKKAAEDDHGRTMSGMVVRILGEWLTEHEYLQRTSDSKRTKRKA
jgi:hypothetical protein